MISEQAIRYNSVARTLHWLIAAALIVQITLGIGHEAWKDLFPAMSIHMSLGLTILALSIIRLGWRLAHPVPPLPASLPRWQAGTARTVHWLFYILLIGAPLTGWAMASASPYPIQWFDLFDVFKLPVMKDSPAAEAAHVGHGLIALLFLLLLPLHIGAALYHRFVLKDGVLGRMI